jgi:Asp-tRNA(Asn)/Glu-tRNA(Gln) amidotransferase A subunit family amidase
VFEPWFRHATPEVVDRCETLLEYFEQQGARRVEIEIPNLEAARIAHTVIIASEMTQALAHYYAEHHREHGQDVRLNLALARSFTARDYLKAQQVRTQLMRNFQQALTLADVVITPATGLTAPKIPSKALKYGESDLTTLVEIMRFATPANLTGLPAIAFPAGYDSQGLPVGMQVVGRAWQETTLLRLAATAERKVDRQKPRRFYHLMSEDLN